VTPEAEVITYSARDDTGADVTVQDLRLDASGSHGRITTPWGEGAFSSRLMGRFNVSNLLAAICAARLAGQGLEALLAALPRVAPVPGRMQFIPNSRGLQVVVDYAHTPDALEQVLSALRAHNAGRLLTVFGCGGERDSGKRPEMGRIAALLSDEVIVTSDNPRGEDPGRIAGEIAEGCGGECAIELDRAAAIALALEWARPGDCVLIAGKGHEDYQIVGGERRPFSDLRCASDLLSGAVAP